ncbi:MAG TPA: O-antigen ligase family protein [Gemmatimonadaceae bacterium]|nr:O-antigen ligase family protein [Gemmatimonadaceae bacterium]
MMPRRHIAVNEPASSVTYDPLATSPAIASRWAMRVRGRSASVESAGDGLLTGVRWTIPYVAFLGYILAITTYRLPIGSVAIVAGLAGLLFQSGPRRFPWLLIWFAAFVLWCAIGYVYSPYPQRTWDGLVALAKLWAIVLVGVNAFRSRAQIRFFMVFFLACFALYPLRGAFANYFLYRYTVFGRAIWNQAFENPNDLAAFALLQLAMVAALLSVERRVWLKRCAQAGLVLLPLLILMTQSRGAFIGLALFSVGCVIGQWRRIRRLLDSKRRLRMISVTLCVIAAVSYFAPDAVWKRLEGMKYLTNTQQLNEVDSEGSARQRWEIWRVATKIIGEHPALGVGVSAYPLAHVVYARGEEFNPTAAGERDTHSTLLNLLAETGVPGTLFFLCMVISVVIDAERARRECKRRGSQRAMPLFFLEIGLLAFFGAGTFGSFGYLAFLYIHLTLLCMTADATRRELGSERAAFLGAN